jgi:hypothetical protein
MDSGICATSSPWPMQAVTPSDFKLENASDRRKASARSHGAMVANAMPLNALRYRPTQLRHPVSIPRGLVSHAADPLDA